MIAGGNHTLISALLEAPPLCRLLFVLFLLAKKRTKSHPMYFCTQITEISISEESLSLSSKEYLSPLS